MNYEVINGKKYIVVKFEIKNINDAKTGEYVEYNDKVYKFLGWEYGTYPILEDVETGDETQIYPYC